MTALLALVLLRVTPNVKLIRAPYGIQPQVGRTADGQIHCVGFVGAAEGGDLDYGVSKDDGATWSYVQPVQPIPRAAVAIGNIRGAQIAVSAKGDVALAWNGSKEAAAEMKTGNQSPLMVSVKRANEKAFSYPVNVGGTTRDLDGGATVAIDGKGTIGVFWHAASATSKGEAERAVWMATRPLSGGRFSPPKRLEIGNLGACGCCSMKAIGEASGFSILYRSATDSTKRDTWRLRVAGDQVEKEKIDPWNLNFCPMSSFSLASGQGKTWMAWETEGKIRVGTGRGFTELSGSGKAKHPALAISGDYVLCAWTEGMGWQRGGTVRWGIVDREGRVLQTSGGDVGRVPMWSLVTAFVRRDGGFAIVY